MARGPPPTVILVSAVVLFVWFILLTSNHDRSMTKLQKVPKLLSGSEPLDAPHLPPETQHGDAIMPTLGNETAKAELGRAAWKLFHTTMARFPDKPTREESDALKSYIYLFARLYPCGECAQHFQQILKKYPPQTSSRRMAAAWGCFVHNEVNESKGKPIFDCNNIGDFYQCGCDEDEEENEEREQAGTTRTATPKSAAPPGTAATDNAGSRHEPFEISKEGPTRGG